MRKRFISAAMAVCMLVLATSAWMSAPAVHATGDTWSTSQLLEQVNELDSVILTTSRPQLKQFLEDVRDQANLVLNSSDISSEDNQKTGQSLQYALKLANDANASNAAGLWADTPFIVYETTALSPQMRLPSTLPEDGTVSDQIQVVSAQDEYEAASFVIAPLSDVGSVTFTLQDLQGENAVIPASAVDMQVVKTWYQGGTAWQSYFFDDYKDVLVPELLLHDENLVMVDDVQKKNFLRVDYPTGSEYVDVSGSPPQDFHSWDEPVADSPVLLPIALQQGQSKQMWVTTKVPSGTPEGIYTGTIAITADGSPAGQLELQIRVLPFELPDPKTYGDLNKDFYVMIYHSATLKNALTDFDGNTTMAETALLNRYRNLVEHNVVNLPPNAAFDVNHPEIFLLQLELMEQAGVSLNPLFGVGPTFPSNEDYNIFSSYLIAKKAYEDNPTEANQTAMENSYNAYLATLVAPKAYIQNTFDAVSQAVGHTNIYFDAWDEGDLHRLQWQQPLWDYTKNVVGAKIFATGNDTHLDLPIKEDFLNWSGDPTREKADSWHALSNDKLITNYAYPHSGPENPDFMRQRHGMWVYKANYDATYNYIWYFESSAVNAWGDYVDATYRAFNFVYPTQTDVINTIAWEGFREGIDDIRYATKLQQVAQDAIASGDAGRISVANSALAWLDSVDERSSDSNFVRSEMIHQIVKMLSLANVE